MKKGDRVTVSGGAHDGKTCVVVQLNGASTKVRFAEPVPMRNGMLSEEVWIARKQLRPVA